MTDPFTQLDEQWNTLGQTYDGFYSSLPKKVQDVIKAAMSKWQDFYYGNFEDWPADQLKYWNDVFTSSAQTLKAGIPAGAKAEVPHSAPITQKLKEQPVFISGKLTPDIFAGINFNMPPWWAWALGALPALAILYYTRKRSI